MESLFDIAYLINLCEKVEGRTRIQKTVYILQYLGYPLNEDFSYSYFGPYSDDLRNEIDFLTSVGILQETIQDTTYVYEPTSKMGGFLEDSDKLLELKTSDKFTELLDKLQATSIPVLEVASTIFFLKKDGLKDKKDIEAVLNDLKPHRKSYFKEAFNLTASLDKYRLQ